jgi:hypothetical protein
MVKTKNYHSSPYYKHFERGDRCSGGQYFGFQPLYKDWAVHYAYALCTLQKNTFEAIAPPITSKMLVLQKIS